ncbi:uncharacterized protein LOC128990105 isoform X1 [Macrosteles quadrilineatus]|uniref:uncharacterized protein LOC128990105 isoform X1 n=1 Tax=Macrosteles quadrilineatus TaxID=74068 RepID=UPI0023E2B582|nr:uncharacterized protein LOC128990105 isoform X1 [Macrosteles quadrilineatus]
MSADVEEVAEAPRETPSPSMKSGSAGSKGSAMKASSCDLRQPSDQDDTDSELSDGENFLTKGAFLLTPSNELNMEKASAICEKMNFRGPYSLTKTATGILFKFAEMDDYQATFKKGFHKVTGARFYKKIPIPCRPQKTFVVFVLEVPDEVPEEDIRHALYKYSSVVEVCRLQGGVVASGSGTSLSSAGGQQGSTRALDKVARNEGSTASSNISGSIRSLDKAARNEFGTTSEKISGSIRAPDKAARNEFGTASEKISGSTRALDKVARNEGTASGNTSGSEAGPILGTSPPPIVRITLASIDEYNSLITNGFDFYGATFFPTEAATANMYRNTGRKGSSGNVYLPPVWYPNNRRYSRYLDLPSGGGRVRDLLPVFDSTAFAKIPPPASKTVKPK